MSSPAVSGQQTGGGGNTRYWAANTDQHLSRSPRCPQSSTSGIAGSWVTPSHSGTLSYCPHLGSPQLTLILLLELFLSRCWGRQGGGGDVRLGSLGSLCTPQHPRPHWDCRVLMGPTQPHSQVTHPHPPTLSTNMEPTPTSLIIQI